MDQCLRPAVLHTVCTSQSQTIPFLTSNIQVGFAVLREQVGGVTPLKASCQGHLLHCGQGSATWSCPYKTVLRTYMPQRRMDVGRRFFVGIHT